MKKILYSLLILTFISCTSKYKELFTMKHKEYETLRKKYEDLNTNYVNSKDEVDYLRDQYKIFYYENEQLKLKIDSLKKQINKTY